MTKLAMAAVVLVAGCGVEKPPEEQIDNWLSMSSISPACSDFVYFTASAYGRGIVCTAPSGNLISVETGTYRVDGASIAWRPDASTCTETGAPSRGDFGSSEGRLILAPRGKPVVYDRNDATIPGMQGPADAFVGTLGCIRLVDMTFAESALRPIAAP